MKKMTKRFTAATLTLALTLTSVCGGVRIKGVSEDVKTSHAAESQGKYVSTIEISNASSKKNAEKELGGDFTVLDTDFGKSAGTHAWIGYTTTDDADKAITDIKVMDMDGDFNYSDYKDLLEKQKQAIEEQMDTILPAVKEYAKNYDSGYFGATRMYDMLNAFYEDDSQKGMGDYLLDAGRSLDLNAENSNIKDDLTKVFMQGNDSVIQTIESILFQAQGSKQKEGSWMIRMSNMGPDGLEKIYKQAYPKYPKNKLKNQMKDDLDETAALILENLDTVQASFKECENTELWQAIENEEDDKIEGIIDEKMGTNEVAEVETSMSDDDAAKVVSDSITDAVDASEMGENVVNSALIMFMKSLGYGKDTSIYDFFMRTDLKAEDLYPMAYLISRGQKSLMEDVGVYGLFMSVLSEGTKEDIDSDDAGSMQELAGLSQSVYDGVDRGVFESDTAITGPAMQRTETTEEIPYLCNNVYYNLGLATSVITMLVAFWKTFDVKVVDGYMRGKGVIDLNNTLQKNRYKVAWAKLDLAYKTYEEKLASKLSRAKLNCMKNEVRYLEKGGFIETGSVDYTKFSKKTYKEALARVNKTDYNRLYTKNGPMTKYTSKVTKLAAKNEAKLNAMWDKIGSKQDKLNKRVDLATKKATFWGRNGARIVTAVAALVAVAMAAYEIYDLVGKEHEKTTYSDIDMPVKMIDRTYPSGSESIEYVTYTAGLKANGKKADLHNWKGDGWLNIYTTTDPDAGDAIYAQDFAVSAEATSADPDLTAVVRFGENNAYDVSGNKGYLMFRRTEGSAVVANQEAEETEDTDEAEENESGEPDAEAAVFGGPIAIWILLILLVIALIGAGAGVYFGKRKKSK